jgi:hypothetical protein
MELHLSHSELITILRKHAVSNFEGEPVVSINIAITESDYAFPPHIAEILSHCSVKGVIDVGENKSPLPKHLK